MKIVLAATAFVASYLTTCAIMYATASVALALVGAAAVGGLIGRIASRK